MSVNGKTAKKSQTSNKKTKKVVSQETKRVKRPVCTSGQEVIRDKKGRFLNSGNPNGCADPRIIDLRNKMRDRLPDIMSQLQKEIVNGDPKVKGVALKIWFDHTVPKPRGFDYHDMHDDAKAALKKIGKLPVEDQPAELLKMFYDGNISEYVLDVATRTLNISQHIKDERIEQLLSKREKEQG